jgi:two-component system, OmpR family, sensor histidine kinase KdpD
MMKSGSGTRRTQRIRRPRNPLTVQAWHDAFDLLAPHSVLATIAGLVVVAAMVPVLLFIHGPEGFLGPSLPLFFLIPVLLASALGGGRAGVIVSIVAVFAWDWFFIPPVHHITVATPRDLLALTVFMADALLTGRLASIARKRTREAMRRARTSEALYELSSALIGRRSIDEVLPALTDRLKEVLDLQSCAVLLSEDGTTWRTVAVSGNLPSELRVETSRAASSAAGWVSRSGRISGWHHDEAEGQTAAGESSTTIRAEFLPLRLGSTSIGVLELLHRPGTRPDDEQEPLLLTLANGVAIALDQERRAEAEQEAKLAQESDALKSALLSSVSHDLRTPLAGIKAASSSLLQKDINWSEEDRRSFLLDIDSEADRLARLVSNLLDLSRIEAGALKPVLEWEDARELIQRVVRRCEPTMSGHPVETDVDDDLPLVRLDTVLTEQVLTNLLDNASKYSAPGTTITIEGHGEQDTDGRPTVVIAVIDRGPGISPSEQSRIFEKFYRARGASRGVKGTGIGLAIVKGLMEAQDGRVSLRSSPGQGSTFTLTIPVDERSARRTGKSPSRPEVEASR